MWKNKTKKIYLSKYFLGQAFISHEPIGIDVIVLWLWSVSLTHLVAGCLGCSGKYVSGLSRWGKIGI